MNADYIDLSYWQVALAAALVLVNAAVSLALRLGLERQLLVAAVRTVVQLLLIGYVLKWVFATQAWYLVVMLMAIMATIAGTAAVRRTDRRYSGIWVNSIVSVWASSWVVTLIALTAIVRADPWYQPQYAIPLLGMILGNTLNGISLGLNQLTGELSHRRHEVEALLAIGATRWEAARGAVQQAVRIAMIPIINSMMVVGIVSLPGMMTGQLLSGTDPLSAVKYQIVIMFLIAAGTALGTFSVVLLSYRQLFNARHQFLYDRISDAK